VLRNLFKKNRFSLICRFGEFPAKPVIFLLMEVVYIDFLICSFLVKCTNLKEVKGSFRIPVV
jgi:hypothetical protein